MPGQKRGNYMQNIGRSVKFSAIDILTETMPNTKDFISTNSDSMTGLVKELQSIKSGQKRLYDALNNTKSFQYGQEALKNAIADIKSGKLNNKDRENALYEEDDFDWGDDGDGMSFDEPGDSGSSSSKGGPHVVIKEGPATAAIAKNTAHQNTILGSGFKSVTDTQKGAVAATLGVTQVMHKENITALTSINKNISSMIDFNNETMSKFALGSMKYYDDSLNLMTGMLDELKKTNEYYDSMRSNKEEPDNERPDYQKVFSSRGVMNMSKYADVVKKNFTNAVEGDMILGPIKDFLTNEDMLKAFAANPLGSVSSFIAGGLIPLTLKRASAKLDETLSSFFPALIMKINRSLDSDNYLAQFLAKTFGVQTDMSRTPDLSKYERGRVDFDGVTRKSIVEVIPTYLRKILAAISGKEEMIYNYDEGKFQSHYNIKKKFDDEETDRMVNPFYKMMRDMEKQIEEGISFKNDKEKDEMREDIKSFFFSLAMSDKGFNPLKDSVKDITNEHRSLKNSKNADIIHASYLNMSRGKQMGTALSTMKARGDQMQFFNDMMADPARAAMLGSLFGWTDDNDSHISRNEHSPEKYKVKGNFGGLFDKYGNSTTDYLRDIKEILLEGIEVFVVGKKGKSNTGGFSTRLGNYKRAKDNSDTNIWADDNSGAPTDRTNDDIGNDLADGMLDYHNLKGFTPQMIANNLKFMQDSKANPQKGEGGIYGLIDRYINQETFGTKISSIKESIEKFFKSPITLFTTAIDKIDSALYTIIYGDDDGNSIVTVAINSMKNTFNKFNTWLKDKVLNPLNEKLFGKDGFMNSKPMLFLKEKGQNVLNYIFGKTDATGNRSGGVLSSTFNNVTDIFKGVRHNLFGTAYTNADGKQVAYNDKSVFAEIKDSVMDSFRMMKVHLFGEDKVDKNGNKISLADRMSDTIAEGYNNFKNFFFGNSGKDNKKEFKETLNNFKEKMPRSLAYGVIGAGLATFTNFGILGTLFLPGGPIGGALVGTAVGMLSQSEKFKSWLFGPKGVDGKRMGGFISKSVIGWFSKNKVALIGGATFGAVKGLINASGMLNMFGSAGYMASWFLPGGPVAGALMGAALGVLTKTETFQKFLFGPKDADGKRTGGALSKMFGKSMSKHLPNMAFGALSFGAAGAVIGQMGLMGAMLTPFGPIGAAVMGAATGIAISSEKFKKFLFGEEDEKTGLKKAGLFKRISNVFTLSIVEPFKLKMDEISFGIKKWFTLSIANPFRDALEPMKTQFKLMMDDMKKMFYEGWNSFKTFLGETFTKYVGEPFGTFMEQRVMRPLRSFLGGLVKGIGRVFGSILASPVKALSIVAGSMQAYQERRGLSEDREERVNNLGKSVKNWFTGKGNEEGQGIWSNLKSVGSSYFTEKGRNEGKSRIADYRDAEAKRIAERNAEQAKAFGLEEAGLKSRRDELKTKRDSAAKINFGTTYLDKNGNLMDARDLYGGGEAALAVSKEIDKSNTFLAKIERGINVMVARMTGSVKEAFSGSIKESDVVKINKKDPAFGDLKRTGFFGKTKMRGNRYGGIGSPVSSYAGPEATPEAVEEAKSSGFGFMGLQLFGDRNYTGDNESHGSRDDHEDKKEKKYKFGSLGEDILSYVKIIAESVNGQLNGVGSNVYKSRQLLEIMAGVNSDDMTGSNNKDRVTIFGRLRNKLMTLITNPALFIKDILMIPIRVISKVVTPIINVVKNTVSFAWTTIKETGALLKEGAVTILKGLASVPGAIFNIAKDVVTIGKDLLIGGIKIVTKGALGIMSATFKAANSAIGAIGSVLEGIGKGVSSMIEGVGLLGKEILKGVGGAVGALVDVSKSLASGVIGMISTGIEATFKIATAAANTFAGFIKTTLNLTASLVKTVATTLVDFVKAPFQFASNLLGKMLGKTNQVYVTGGTLEKVEKVVLVERVNYVSGKGKRKGIYDGFASGEKKTASLMNALSAEKKEADFNHKNEMKQTGFLSSIADTTKKQFGMLSDGFKSFLKYGAMAVAAIAGLGMVLSPFVEKIKAILKKLGLWSDDGGSAASGDKGNPLADGTERRAAGGVLIGNENMKERYLTDGLGWAAGKASGMSSINPLKGVWNGIKSYYNAKDSVRSVLGPKDATGAEKMGRLESFGSSIKDSFKAKYDSIKKTLGDVIDKVFNSDLKSKVSSEAISTLTTKLKDLVKTKFTMEVFKANMQKFTNAALKSAGLLSNPVGWVVTGIFGIWDVGTGWFEAANLFRVSEDNVDYKMKIISSLIKGITNFPVCCLLDIFLSVISGLAGGDYHEWLADFLYGLLGDVDELKMAQGKFNADKDAYNAANGTELSLDAYNDMKNKSVFDGVADWVSGGWAGIKNFFGFGDNKNSSSSSFVGGGSGDGVMSVFDKAGSIVKDIGDMTYQFWNDANKTMSDAFDDMTKSIKDMLSKLDTKFGQALGFKDANGNDMSFSDKASSVASNAWQGIKNFANGVYNMFAGSGKSSGFAGAGNDVYKKKGGFIGGGMGNVNNFPYYSQFDPDYADKPFWSMDGMTQGTISEDGCGPASMAMVASALTGKQIDPVFAADAAAEGGYRVPGGVSEGFFPTFASDAGLSAVSVSNDRDAVISNLQQGYPMIFGGRKTSATQGFDTPFTNQGHYVVGVASDGAGGVMVNDPRGEEYSKDYDIDTLLKETQVAFAFSQSDNPDGNPLSQGGSLVFTGRQSLKKSAITGMDIIASGATQLGLPYVLGGDGISSTDCGKFTQDTFARLGLTLNSRTADEQYNQYANAGAITDTLSNNASVGDLVFFANTYGDWPAGTPTHVGIYAGGGQMLHAGSSTGVAYADITSGFWADHFLGMGSTPKLFGTQATPGEKFAGNNIKGKFGVPGKNGQPKKKPRTLLDMLGHVGKMFSNFALSSIAGKSYTGTAWDDDPATNPNKSYGMASAGSLGGGNLDPKDAYKFFKNNGYSDVAIAGILGNIQQEHSFSSSDVPLDYSSGIELGGCGLFQWTKTRRDALIEYANSTGRDYTDPGTQLDFMVMESRERNDVTPDKMNVFGDPAAAALHFNDVYEGGTEGNRAEYANAFYSQITSGGFAGAGNGKRKFVGGGGSVKYPKYFVGGGTIEEYNQIDYENDSLDVIRAKQAANAKTNPEGSLLSKDLPKLVENGIKNYDIDTKLSNTVKPELDELSGKLFDSNLSKDALSSYNHYQRQFMGSLDQLKTRDLLEKVVDSLSTIAEASGAMTEGINQMASKPPQIIIPNTNNSNVVLSSGGGNKLISASNTENKKPSNEALTNLMIAMGGQFGKK